MLFGTFHLMHGTEDSDVSTYEENYPHLTFVISDLGIYDTNREPDRSALSHCGPVRHLP